MVTAFIPARSGSKRLPGKNVRTFFGHPLIAYTIQAAFDSGIFGGEIYVSSDSEEIGKIAVYYGAKFILRPPELAGDTSPDAEWISHAQGIVSAAQFAILRPTSPFRTAHTIKRAFARWNGKSHLKAVESVSQRPEKMWKIDGYENYRIHPLHEGKHLEQSSTFERLMVQNGCLEIRTAGKMDGYQAFLTHGFEGIDINTSNDWIIAEALLSTGAAVITKIERAPYAPTAV